jgi:hypothetical protein
MDASQKGTIELLHGNGIWIQDTLSVLFSLRPCIRFGLTKQKFFLLRRALPKLGLKGIIYLYREINKPVILIGKDKKTLKEAYLSEKSGDQSRLGRFLGYPSCCIDSLYDNRDNIKTIPLVTNSNTETAPDFRLNYLLNLDSRIIGDELKGLESIKGKYNNFNTYIIPHIPCSFDCKPTKTYAMELSKTMSIHFPEYLAELEAWIKRPILWLSNLEFLPFDGHVKGNVLSYNKSYDTGNLFDRKIISTIIKGDSIEIEEGSFIVKKGDSLVTRVKERASLFSFS